MFDPKTVGSRVPPGTFKKEHDIALDDTFRKVMALARVTIVGSTKIKRGFRGNHTA